LTYTRRALRADRDNWRAMALEAYIFHGAGKHAQAVRAALNSLSLMYFQPALHYLMGASLLSAGREGEAEQSFQVALSQNPGLAPAHTRLAEILRRRGQIGEAGLHLAQAQASRQRAKQRQKARLKTPGPKPESTVAGFDHYHGPPADRAKLIVVVAGLPRSGTSMLMQMLAAGGIPPYTDGNRGADEDNPRGYFEHANAIRLHQDSAWVPEARGKAVKIVASLLPYLPPGEEYRIVFALRNLAEVIASQRAMLDRLGRPGAALKEDALTRAYAGQLVRANTWLRSHDNVQAVGIDYASALRDPAAAAEKLAAFLGQPFNAGAAAASIVPRLRRQSAAV